MTHDIDYIYMTLKPIYELISKAEDYRIWEHKAQTIIIYEHMTARMILDKISNKLLLTDDEFDMCIDLIVYEGLKFGVSIIHT